MNALLILLYKYAFLLHSNSRLAAYPPVEPLLYVPSFGESSSFLAKLPFLPRSSSTEKQARSRLRVKFVSQSFMPNPASGRSDLDLSKQFIISTLLKSSEMTTELGDSPLSENDVGRVTYHDFNTIGVSSSKANRTNPLHVETATQLGLMSDLAIPSLIRYLLPDLAPASTRRFLRRWLLTPPPAEVAAAMSTLVSTLKTRDHSLPPLCIPPIGKVLSLM